MELSSALIVIALAALIHATFQLSVSVLTLMSSHSLGLGMKSAPLSRRMIGFSLGAISFTTLLLAATTYLLDLLYLSQPPLTAQVIIYGLIGISGLAVWQYYFRGSKGTKLWLPKSLADFLTKRSKKTSSSAEAYSLGLTSVAAEILFILAPIVASAMTLISLPAEWQIAGLALYVIVSALPLLIVTQLVRRGYRISHIQRWRESNKRFLQFASGAGLILLAFYLYTSDVISHASLAMGA